MRYGISVTAYESVGLSNMQSVIGLHPPARTAIHWQTLDRGRVAGEPKRGSGEGENETSIALPATLANALQQSQKLCGDPSTKASSNMENQMRGRVKLSRTLSLENKTRTV